MKAILLTCMLVCVIASLGVERLSAAEVRGVTVTPHVVASSMKYRRPRDPALGARVKLFVKGSALPGTVGGKTPAEHLKAGDWGWHDFHTAIQGPDESLSVWTWNGNATSWGVGNHVEVRGDGLAPTSVSIEAPRRWISNVTFPGAESDPKPREMIVHVRNASERDLTITAVRLWLPKDNKTWQTLFATDVKSVNSKAPAGERAVVHVRYAAALPLTYAAVELVTNDGSLWEHLRIKRDTFDISGGWIGDHLRHEPYLRLLSQLHVNCGQIEGVDGYTNNRELYERYPFKLFNRLQPLSEWDTDEWLPKIHAVEVGRSLRRKCSRRSCHIVAVAWRPASRIPRSGSGVTTRDCRTFRITTRIGLSLPPPTCGGITIGGTGSGSVGARRSRRLATCVGRCGS
jgi:hypothetical protein